jgi:anti-sigma regulatory factor (Ser/Thr protein kinase)
MKMRLQKPFSAEAFRKSREVMAGFWLESGINDNLAWDLVCVADEIIANVIEHANATWLEWDISFDSSLGMARIVFRDDGVEFDTSKAVLKAEEAAGDGTQRHLGLLVVVSVMDNITYSRQADKINEIEMAVSSKGKKVLATAR